MCVHIHMYTHMCVHDENMLCERNKIANIVKLLASMVGQMVWAKEMSQGYPEQTGDYGMEVDLVTIV